MLGSANGVPGALSVQQRGRDESAPLALVTALLLAPRDEEGCAFGHQGGVGPEHSGELSPVFRYAGQRWRKAGVLDAPLVEAANVRYGLVAVGEFRHTAVAWRFIQHEALGVTPRATASTAREVLSGVDSRKKERKKAKIDRSKIHSEQV